MKKSKTAHTSFLKICGFICVAFLLDSCRGSTNCIDYAGCKIATVKNKNGQVKLTQNICTESAFHFDTARFAAFRKQYTSDSTDVTYRDSVYYGDVAKDVKPNKVASYERRNYTCYHHK